MKIFPMERHIFNPGIRFAYITARYRAKSAVTDKLTGHIHQQLRSIMAEKLPEKLRSQ